MTSANATPQTTKATRPGNTHDTTTNVSTNVSTDVTSDATDVTSDATTGTDRGAVTAYYDGACPVCRREIGMLQRRAPEHAVNWVDAAACDSEALGSSLERTDALARMHVRSADGELVSGAAAFGLLWQQIPGMTWLGKLVSLRPVLWVLEPAYRGFLKVRQLWRPATSVH